MTKEQILKSLEGEFKKEDIEKLIDQLVENTGKESSKKANVEAKNLRDRLKKVLGAVELEESDLDDEDKVAELKTLRKPETKEKLTEADKMAKEFAKLKKDFEAVQAKEKVLIEKNHASLKKTSLIKVLQERNAIDPDLIAEVLAGKVKVKDDDSLVFLDGDNEVDVAIGVEGYLETKKHLIKNSQSPGAGSSSGGQAGTQTPSIEQYSAMSLEEYAKNRPK